MRSENVGKLILRLALGGLVLLHGLAKLQGGVGSIERMLTATGLPPLLAYGVYVGELVAPVLVLLGFYARIGAALIAVNMIMAIFLAHRAELLALGGSGGWALELQGMFLFGALALMLIGPGRHGFNEK